MVRRSLRPLKALARQADAIASGSLDARPDAEAAPVELRCLVSRFNDALDRLEAGFALQRAFTANAAHELRTPVAALRAEVESGRADRAVLTAQCDRMGRMLGQLLALAEAERQSPPLQAPMDLGALARQALIDHGPAAMRAGRSAAFEVAPDATGEGDPGLTDIALRNLIENAARHAPQGAGILVAAGPGLIEVSDDGPPIPPAVVARMFDRFWKADRRTVGGGLGLSIVEAAMARQGGAVRFERRNGLNVFALRFRQG
ncbi:Signal transduction histidine kinase [Rubrimonas cliftonensis]|uniref:histidine kinase n=1 Tax=Rubrimonas cliftonensis TaxID=89524 RepID=A0A1H4G7L9_9RHOB|nr:Signal transduction histidine kinase [Rubrimonas cliftonensis]